MDYRKITLEYYSKWLGADIPLMEMSGAFWVPSKERDQKQIGYSDEYSVYAFVRDDSVIISYGIKASEQIGKCKDKLKSASPIREIDALLEQAFMKKLNHSVKYVFEKLPMNALDTVKATMDDYGLYADFFRSVNRDCLNIDWLRDYYQEICEKEHCYAVMRDGIFVSVTDAPSMPYMDGIVQEIGINTREEYKRNGYGKAACISCIESMLHRGICPQWSTSIDNTASQKLAQSVGFVKLADVLTVTL